MPLMDYKCLKCNKKETLFFWPTEARVAPECCMTMVEDWSRSNVLLDHPVTLNHVEWQPKTFQTKKEMRDYAREHKLELGALL
jgi:hypothetical protein